MNTAEVTMVETSFEQVLQMAQRLPITEQIRLIARLAPMAEQAIPMMQAEDIPKPALRRTARGILAGMGPAPTAEEIDEARREMWGNFPRDDF